MKVKVYLSDEGFGHIVRQRAILEALKSLVPKLDVTIQTKKYAAKIPELIPYARVIEKYSNITWHKRENGSPDRDAIEKYYSDYHERSRIYIEQELKTIDKPDFILSDFVYEAFEVGNQLNVPVFGSCHFTWDWFLSKLYPIPISSELQSYFLSLTSKATRIFFPYMTPADLLEYYGERAEEVPFIISREVNHKKLRENHNFKILIADSGAGVLKASIKRALATVGGLQNIDFYVPEAIGVQGRNIISIAKNELLVDYMRDMDLVLGRAGYNTICECISVRTPMLLLGEALNPEMMENILQLKRNGLASHVSLDRFENSLPQIIEDFRNGEMEIIQRNLNLANFKVNGAEVIAQRIIESL